MSLFNSHAVGALDQRQLAGWGIKLRKPTKYRNKEDGTSNK